MFRSDAQVALNDLLVALRESADLYADDAELADGAPELAALFETLARRRSELGEELAAQVRKSGDLPRLPDADRETLLRLGNRFRSRMAPNALDELIGDRLAAEGELAQRVAEALCAVGAPEPRLLLNQLQREVGAARRRLEAARHGLTH